MPLLSSSTLLALLTPCLLSLSYLLITSPTTLLPSPTIYLLGSSMALRPATFPFLLSRDALQKPQFQSQLSPTSTPPNSNTATATSTITATRELLSLLGLLLATLTLILATFSRSLSYSKSDFLSSSASTSSSTSNSSAIHPSSSDNFNASNANAALGEKLHTLLSAQTLWQTLCAGLVFSSGAVVAFTYLQADSSSSSSSEINTARVLANDVVFACCMASMLFWGYLYTVLAEERREVLGWVARRQAEQRG